VRSRRYYISRSVNGDVVKFILSESSVGEQSRGMKDERALIRDTDQ
jgi:hypothetical protein